MQNQTFNLEKYRLNKYNSTSWVLSSLFYSDLSLTESSSMKITNSNWCNNL
jgi:hypothetical protein